LAHRELADLFAFFAGFHIALFDDAATDRFDALTGAGPAVRELVGLGSESRRRLAACKWIERHPCFRAVAGFAGRPMIDPRHPAVGVRGLTSGWPDESPHALVATERATG
jgi:hypothetical protein